MTPDEALGVLVRIAQAYLCNAQDRRTIDAAVAVLAKQIQPVTVDDLEEMLSPEGG